MKIRMMLATLATLLCLPAFAHEEVFFTNLTGAAEALPTGSPAIGTATITFDLDLLTMRVETSFSGLLGNVTAAHIHCCTTLAGTGTVGVASSTPTFPSFPSGVKAGSYDRTFDMTMASSYNAAFVTARGGNLTTAFNDLLTGMESGKAYLNIHTSSFGSGEIRGFLAPVPEPTTYAMLGAGLALLGFARRRTSTAA